MHQILSRYSLSKWIYSQFQMYVKRIQSVEKKHMQYCSRERIAMGMRNNQPNQISYYLIRKSKQNRETENPSTSNNDSIQVDVHCSDWTTSTESSTSSTHFALKGTKMWQSLNEWRGETVQRKYTIYDSISFRCKQWEKIKRRMECRYYNFIFQF